MQFMALWTERGRLADVSDGSRPSTDPIDLQGNNVLLCCGLLETSFRGDDLTINVVVSRAPPCLIRSSEESFFADR